MSRIRIELFRSEGEAKIAAEVMASDGYEIAVNEAAERVAFDSLSMPEDRHAFVHRDAWLVIGRR